MLYDIYDDEGRHSTPETFMELSKKLRRYSIPSEKIGLGLPFYAKPSDRTAYWYAYADYCDKLNENGFYYDSGLDKAFWFNRPSEIAEKTRFAVEKGFGGVMIWHYSCDLPSSNPHSLLKAVGDTVSSLSSV